MKDMDYEERTRDMPQQSHMSQGHAQKSHEHFSQTAHKYTDVPCLSEIPQHKTILV